MQKKWLNLITLYTLICCFTYNILAEPTKATKVSPRFVTVKSNQVNARTGPGASYPIEWVFVYKGEPLKVIAEFEQWRKVEDIDGKGGWVHSSVLSPKRSVIMIGDKIHKLYSSNNSNSRVVAKLEPSLRCMLDKISKDWCKIKCDNYKGWIESSKLWGLLPEEKQI